MFPLPAVRDRRKAPGGFRLPETFKTTDNVCPQFLPRRDSVPNLLRRFTVAPEDVQQQLALIRRQLGF